jgi:hypothetical protein
MAELDIDEDPAELLFRAHMLLFQWGLERQAQEAQQTQATQQSIIEDETVPPPITGASSIETAL